MRAGCRDRSKCAPRRRLRRSRPLGRVPSSDRQGRRSAALRDKAPKRSRPSESRPRRDGCRSGAGSPRAKSTSRRVSLPRPRRGQAAPPMPPSPAVRIVRPGQSGEPKWPRSPGLDKLWYVPFRIPFVPNIDPHPPSICANIVRPSASTSGTHPRSPTVRTSRIANHTQVSARCVRRRPPVCALPTISVSSFPAAAMTRTIAFHALVLRAALPESQLVEPIHCSGSSSTSYSRLLSSNPIAASLATTER